jgi:hypothetical protein
MKVRILLPLGLAVLAANAVAAAQSTNQSSSPTAAATSAPTLEGLSSEAKDVVNLNQSGVSEEVILSYIDNVPTRFNLTVNHVVLLKRAGLSARVVSAMARHDENLMKGALSRPQIPPATNRPVSQPATHTTTPAKQVGMTNAAPPKVPPPKSASAPARPAAQSAPMANSTTPSGPTATHASSTATHRTSAQPQGALVPSGSSVQATAKPTPAATTASGVHAQSSTAKPAREPRYADSIADPGPPPVQKKMRRVIVEKAPPPPRPEIVPLPPGQDYYWQPGHWIWRGGDWDWQDGYWMHQPGTDARWIGGKWEKHGRGWTWIEGRWVR